VVTMPGAALVCILAMALAYLSGKQTSSGKLATHPVDNTTVTSTREGSIQMSLLSERVDSLYNLFLGNGGSAAPYSAALQLRQLQI